MAMSDSQQFTLKKPLSVKYELDIDSIIIRNRNCKARKMFSAFF